MRHSPGKLPFRRSLEYIVVKPFGGKEVGEPFRKSPRVMRMHYRMNRIGPKGHEWTDYRLKKAGVEVEETPDPSPRMETPEQTAQEPQRAAPETKAGNKRIKGKITVASLNSKDDDNG